MLRQWAVLATACLWNAGCLPGFRMPDETATARVPANPFGNAPAAEKPEKGTAQKSTAHFAPANSETARQVDMVGRKLLAANPHVGLKPTFATIGSPSPELFHRDTTLIFITAGLVSRCQSEAELAALLALELGKMVSEREAAVNPKTRDPERKPPISVPIGNAGQFSGSDQTALVEAAKFEKVYSRAPRQLPPPDPSVLARSYLENAGYAKSALDAVGRHVEAAERNFALEKQIRGPQPTWTP